MTDDRKQSTPEGGHQPSARESWLSRHGPYLLLLVYLHYCMRVAIELFRGRVDFLGMLPAMATAIYVLMVAALVGVVVRIVAQLFRRASGVTILRDIIGEPSWWRTWYPRSLRNPESIWDRLPPMLKVMRTVIWLELLLLPAGVVLLLFVLPTYQAVYEAIRVEFPLMMRSLMLAVKIGLYLFPLIALAALVQGRRWRARYGFPRMVALNLWFSVRPGFWRDTEARKLLRH